MLTLPWTSKLFTKLALSGVCAMGVGVATASHAQDTSDPLQRGVGESIRSGIQGGSIGESLRRGVGEAAQSAIESPAQTAQRDQQLRMQQQFDAQQRGQFGTPQGGTLYRDQQGGSYYLDNQGTRVYTQQQGRYSSQQGYAPQQGYMPSQVGGSSQATAQGQIAGSRQTSNQGPTLGVAIENAEQGVRVLNVRPGSAAEEAGLQRGDIIQSVNGQSVRSPQALVQSIHASGGGQLDLQVVRNGQPEQMTAMLSSGDATHRMAKPAIQSGASGQSGMSQQFNQLQTQLAELQKNVESLRQEVMELKTSENGDSVDALPAVPVDESPADLFQDTDDAAADNADADADADAADDAADADATADADAAESN